MKRLVLALAAIAATAGPIATAGTAQAQQRSYERSYDRGSNDRSGGYDRRDNDRRDYDRRGSDRRDYDRRDYRRDNDRHGSYSRWDSRQHNGYYLGSRWHYGTPSVSYYSRHDYRPAYRSWSRGHYLPHSYRSHRVHDYHRYHLRQPPRGYGWVRVNNDYVLMALATGLILDVIVNSGRY